MRKIALFVVLMFVAGSILSCGEENASPQRKIVKVVKVDDKDVTPATTMPTTTGRIEYDDPVFPATDPNGGVRLSCKRVGNSVTCYVAVHEKNTCQFVEVNVGDNITWPRPNERFMLKVVCGP